MNLMAGMCLALLTGLAGGLAAGAWQVYQAQYDPALMVLAFDVMAQSLRGGVIWMGGTALLLLRLGAMVWRDTEQWATSAVRRGARRALAGGISAGLLLMAAVVAWPEVMAQPLRYGWTGGGMVVLAVALVSLIPWPLGPWVWKVAPMAAGLALLGWGGVEWKAHTAIPQPSEAAPNLVIISIDTLRWDHVGLYGHHRDTTPGIDALGAAGVVFDRAWVPSSWTLPTMASIMTGVDPMEHQAIVHDRALPTTLSTMAEVLRAHGYDTAGVISNPFLDRSRGFGAGFRLYDDSLAPEAHGGPTSPRISRIAGSMAAELEEPFLLWAHYIDPHYDYIEHPSIEYAGASELPNPIPNSLLKTLDPADATALDHIRDVYDEEIRFTDQAISTLIRGLTTNRPLIIVLVSDHGEMFGERGRVGHGMEVYEELVRAPLVIGGDVSPALKGKRVNAPVSAQWIYHSVLSWAGIDEDGPDLLRIAAGGKPTERITMLGTDAYEPGNVWVGATDGRFKAVRRVDEPVLEVYDLEVDPGELRPLQGLPTQAEPLVDLTEKLAQGFHYPGQEGAMELDDQQLEALRALGYVE